MASSPEGDAPLTTETAADAFEGILASEGPPEEPEEATEQTSPSEESDPVVEESTEPVEEAAEVAEPEEPELVEWTTAAGQTYKVTPQELRDGYIREIDYRQKTQELADSRRNFDSESTRVAEALKGRVEKLDGLIESLETQVGTNKADVERILAEEGAEAAFAASLQNQKAEEALAAARAERERTSYEEQQHQQAEMAKFIQTEQEKIAADWPEYRDVNTRSTATEELYRYLEGAGFEPAAARNVIDHRQVALIRKAMAYDKAQASKPEIKKQIEGKPKMAKPGQAESRQTRSLDVQKRKLSSLRRTGSRHAAADILADIL